MIKQKYSLAINPSVMDKVDFYAKTNDLSRSAAVNEILFEFLQARYGFLDNVARGMLDELIEGQTELPEVEE